MCSFRFAPHGFWNSVQRLAIPTRLLLVACLLFSPESVPASKPPSLNAEPRDYVLWYRNYDSPAVKAMVELALDKTPEYGHYRLRRSTEMGQGRALKELANGNSVTIDIINVATSIARERELLAIPIPVDGGLLGLRVCVVNEKDREKFVNIRRLSDFSDQNLSIGQGTHWPDTAILQANGIDVVTNTRFEILFGMLKGNRFDCFARGVNEVLFDLEQFKDSNMVVEPYVLLGYPMPSYFFVGPGDHETALRIQLGMERAIQDDSFSRYLKTYYVEAMNRLRLNKRTVLMLDNPYLSEESESVARRTLETLRQRIEGPLQADTAATQADTSTTP